MHPGPHGTAATYSANGRVWGVRIGPGRIDVHVVATAQVPLDRLGQAVRNAVHNAVPNWTDELVVHIEDLSTPRPTSPEHEHAKAASPTEQPRRIP